MKKRNGVRVIRASISTIKAGKMMRKVTGCGMYAKDDILRDVYLAGARDVIGGDLGWAFRRAILTGDMKQVARFCSDGWKVIGDMEAFTSERAALKGIIGIHQSVKQISRNLAAILDDVAKEAK